MPHFARVIESRLSRLFQFLWIGTVLIVCAPGHAGAQTPAQIAAQKAACERINVADPAAVFRCLNTFRDPKEVTHPIHDCSFVQFRWIETLQGVRPYDFRAPPFVPTANDVPSCAAISEAVKLATGQPSVFGACIKGNDVIGSEAHMRKCLQSQISVKQRSTASLNSCSAVFNLYVEGLGNATPREMPGPSGPRRRLFGPSPFDDSNVVPHRDNPNKPDLKVRDCDVAAKVVMAMAGSSPWTACQQYAAPTSQAHLRTCGRPAFTSQMTCPDARAAYERELSKAYGGLPRNYDPPSCDMINAVLAEVAPPQVVTAPAVRSEPSSSSQNPTLRAQDQAAIGLAIAGLIVFVAVWIFYFAFRSRVLSQQIRERIELSMGGGISMGSETYSQTYVSSQTSGGGGYVSPTTGGYIAPSTTTVSSTVAERHRFFLVRDDGSEIAIKINSANSFPTRDGQRLGVVYGTLDQSQTWVVALYNYATRRHIVLDADVERLTGSFKDFRTIAIGAVATVVVALAAFMMINPIAALVAAGVLGAALLYSFKAYWQSQATRYVLQNANEALATIRQTQL